MAAGQTWDNYESHSPMIGLYYGANETMNGIALYYGIYDENGYLNHTEIQKGVWDTVRIHTFMSQSDDGFCELFINDVPITPFNGLDHKYYGENMYNDAPAYLKIGLYRDPHISTVNSVLYDDFKRLEIP